MLNIFAQKKKPLYQTPNQTIQGSGYGSNYASNASNYKAPTQQAISSSSYSTPNYLSSLTKPVAPTIKKQPQMSVAPKPVQQMSTPRPVGPMSVAPKAPLMSVNPNAQKYQAPAPKPYQPPQANPGQEWLNYTQNAGNRQKTFAEQQMNDKMNFLKQRGQLTNQQLLEQIPLAEQNFNTYKGNTEATIADLIKGGEMQKSQATDYYGDAQRQAAQTLRETQGANQRTFANLGTLDSRGEGSFAQANENTMSDFNRFTQQNLRAKADQLTQIDMSVRAAEREARATISQEEQKMNQLKRDIQYAVANNDLETAQGLTQAYNEAQQYIYDIEDAMAQTKYQFGLEQQKLENEMAKVQSFTPEFMATGVPTNQAEYEFFIKNKKDMDTLYGTGNTASSDILNVAKQLKGSNFAGITGVGQTAWLPGSEGALALNTYEQLRGLLSLENREKLKGSGAISDFEAKVLDKAASRLGRNLSNEQFEQVLDELIAELSGGSSTTSLPPLTQYIL